MGNANGVVFEYEKIKRPVTINRDLLQMTYAWHEFSCHVLDGLEWSNVSFGYEIINGIVTSNRDLRQIVEHTIKPVKISIDVRE